MTSRALLCVDDDNIVLRALQRSLRDENYRVIVADTAVKALSLLEKETIQIAMVDQRMPDVDGSTLLQQIKEQHPDVLRLVLSGYSGVSTILDSINKGEVYRFLVKPWNGDELKLILKQCFEHYELQQLNRELIRKVKNQNDELIGLNSKLESVVENRTYLLRLVQEVVQHIPIPLIAVDLAGQIVTANSGFVNKLENKPVSGGHLDDVLPETVWKQVQYWLNDPERYQDNLQIEGGHLGQLRVDIFSFDTEIRGAIISVITMGA